MPGLLDGKIASAIYAGFRGRLLKGTLRRRAASGGLDAHGDPVTVSTTDWSCEGFHDEYDDRFKMAAGIPLTDIKVNIFAKSLPAGVEPKKDDVVKFTQAGVAKWFQLRGAKVDPAGALWTCQAFVIPAPLESA